ncbi:MAG: ABC transporter ATP-binding protein [Planctomycetota bacterium]
MPKVNELVLPMETHCVPTAQRPPFRCAVSSESPKAGEGTVRVTELGKCHHIYERPIDRLRQVLSLGRRRFFREFWALRNISFNIARGETVGIVGRNGCGKSTLLQLICGTLSPSEGQVDVHGRTAALLELGAGFNGEFTGRENVYTYAAILGLSPREIDARYPAIVDFSELADFMDRPVKTYSSGMYVRLAFAVAISVEPDILVIDEALSVGDEAFQRKCFARIEAIQQRGGTILFVSHDAGAMVRFCNRTILLDRGELLAIGMPKAVIAAYHKLLYAPANRAEAVREEILAGRVTVNSHASPIAAAPAVDAETLSPRYDEGLKTASRVDYERCGAEILDPRIETCDGRQVNVLTPHEEYVIRYSVRFDREANGVEWCTLLKTLQGAELSGIVIPEPCDRPLPAGSLVEVAFRWRCLLRPGVYFVNAGVLGTVDGESGYLHRIVDAVMFRVQSGPTCATAGPLDLFTAGQAAS